MLKTSFSVAMAGWLLAALPVLAQSDPAAGYPSKPVKIVVSVPSGAGSTRSPGYLPHGSNSAWGSRS